MKIEIQARSYNPVYTVCIFNTITDYVKDGGLGAVWTSCSFNHNPLRH